MKYTLHCIGIVCALLVTGCHKEDSMRNVTNLNKVLSSWKLDLPQGSVLTDYSQVNLHDEYGCKLSFARLSVPTGDAQRFIADVKHSDMLWSHESSLAKVVPPPVWWKSSNNGSYMQGFRKCAYPPQYIRFYFLLNDSNTVLFVEALTKVE